MAETHNGQDFDLELQETAVSHHNSLTTNYSENGPTHNENSALRQNFYRMREYFNILDRVFHYKRMNTVSGLENSNTREASTVHGSTTSEDYGDNDSNTHILGEGNDGVFSNLSAKPESSNDRRQRLLEVFHQQLRANNNNSDSTLNLGNNSSMALPDLGVYNINQLYEQLSTGAVLNSQQQKPNGINNGRGIEDGEFERSDKPPSYEEAHNDNVPSYWDLSPEGSLYYDEICVLGLPAGSIINFVWNSIVSASFQFFGFLITYILHTSHAAKEGSRCGLGITFLSLGFRIMPNNVSNKVGKGKEILRLQSLNPFNHDLNVFYKAADPNDLELVTDFENVDLLKEKLETHTLLQNLEPLITTTTLDPTQTSTATPTSGSLFSFYHHNNGDIDSFDKSQLVMADNFESHLSHGSEEKYDHNRNVTLMKLLSIVLFVVGSFIIVQSFYQYYKIKMMEKDLVSQQERIDDLRDNYYNNQGTATENSNSGNETTDQIQPV